MSDDRHGYAGHLTLLSLCRVLCIWATWVWVATPLPQAGTDSDAATSGQVATFAIIPSAPKPTALIPSAPIRSTLPPGLIPSAPRSFGLIPSQPPSLVPSQSPAEVVSSSPPPLIPSQPHSGLIPSSPPPGLIPSAPPHTALIPSAPSATETITSSFGIIPSRIGTPIQPDGNATSFSNVSVTLVAPSMASTDEPLIPVPAPTTAPGDPNGHHEIPEPNFTVTVPCRGCSPVIEITATGWGDWPTFLPTTPAADQAGTTKQQPPQATITAGPSNIVVTQQPSSAGGGFVIGGSTTVKPGQTVIVDNTPVVIQTTAGRTEVVVGGTQTVPIQASVAQPPSSITDGPILPILPITIGGQTLTPVANPNFHPGANPTSNPSSDPDINSNPDSHNNNNNNNNPPSEPDQDPTTQDPSQDPSAPPSVTAFPSQYVIAGQTLAPGGPAITVSGTTLSLAPSATAIVVNGQTTTLTRAYGAVYTTTTLPALTLWNSIYTANRAGYYILAPGTTLIPGGPPVTVSGTVISLEPHGTAVMVQGSTSFMQPVTTIVTLTRSGDAAGAGAGMYTNTGVAGSLPYPTGKPNAGVSVRVPGATAVTHDWLSGLFLLGFLGFAWLAVWL